MATLITIDIEAAAKKTSRQAFSRLRRWGSPESVAAVTRPRPAIVICVPTVLPSELKETVFYQLAVFSGRVE
jgi:hypothetical protein